MYFCTMYICIYIYTHYRLGSSVALSQRHVAHSQIWPRNFIFNFDPIEFKDPEVRKTKLSAEIANGRLAMVALMAMLFQNGTVGTTGPAMWLPAA